MNDKILSHSRWDCKYHVVFIPKCRKRILYGQLKKYVGDILRMIAKQKECEVLEDHLCSDHIHMLISIPLKYSGYKMNFRGQKFWARGYYVSTTGRDEQLVREYIKNQEKEDKKEDNMQQGNLFA